MPSFNIAAKKYTILWSILCLLLPSTQAEGEKSGNAEKMNAWVATLQRAGQEKDVIVAERLFKQALKEALDTNVPDAIIGTNLRVGDFYYSIGRLKDGDDTYESAFHQTLIKGGNKVANVEAFLLHYANLAQILQIRRQNDLSELILKKRIHFAQRLTKESCGVSKELMLDRLMRPCWESLQTFYKSCGREDEAAKVLAEWQHFRISYSESDNHKSK